VCCAFLRPLSTVSRLSRVSRCVLLRASPLSDRCCLAARGAARGLSRETTVGVCALFCQNADVTRCVPSALSTTHLPRVARRAQQTDPGVVARILPQCVRAAAAAGWKEQKRSFFARTTRTAAESLCRTPKIQERNEEHPIRNDSLALNCAFTALAAAAAPGEC
jgi:hypothetical protein